jgi:hypothetical protein
VKESDQFPKAKCLEGLATLQKTTSGVAVWNARKRSMGLHSVVGQSVTDAKGAFRLNGIVAGVEHLFTLHGSDFQRISLTAPGELRFLLVLLAILSVYTPK